MRERVARLFSVHAARRERSERAGPGDIVVAHGLRVAATGDTLCDPARPIALEPLRGDEPVISRAVEPRAHADKERLDAALAKVADEDPTFRVREDPDTGQTLVSGMGELRR